MKRILLSVMILICSVSIAYSQESAAYTQESREKAESFGFSFGCFTPQDADFDYMYEDDRDTTFSLFYDKEVVGNFSIGTSLMYYENEGLGVSSALIKSSIKTEFALAKAEVSGIYRGIKHDDQLIVTQLKFGLSGTYFNEKVEGGGRTENFYLGYHAGIAFLMLLDRLDPDHAKKLKRSYGIKDTYFFVGMD